LHCHSRSVSLLPAHKIFGTRPFLEHCKRGLREGELEKRIYYYKISLQQSENENEIEHMIETMTDLDIEDTEREKCILYVSKVSLDKMIEVITNLIYKQLCLV
jgi:hypothetical protein